MKQEYMTGALVVIALIVIWYFFINVGPYDTLAKCMSQKGIKFYGAFWCPHCQAEKALLGNSMRLMNYVECSNPDNTETQACVNAGVQTYPTWGLPNGSMVVGQMTIAQLSAMSGCPSS